jgi:hypothetical protein
MNLYRQLQHDVVGHSTRRHFLKDSLAGLGAIWLASQTGRLFAADPLGGTVEPVSNPLQARPPHFPARAKRVIFLHMVGAPSQLDLFDYKPELFKLDGKDCPRELIEGQRFAFITGTPTLLAPRNRFRPVGDSGQMVAELLPHFGEIVDEICMIKSMHTDQFNHAPAQLLMHTGNPIQGHASFGSWVTYGLGTENQNLPGFIVLVSGGNNPDAGKAGWSAGFLPSVYQGVQCRSEGDPVLYLSNPASIDRDLRRRMLDAIGEVNERAHAEVGDPEILTRVSQYEMAFRMQLHASDALDISKEPASAHAMYGTKPGVESFANNCLLARRLAERGVRFIQLYDWGWDHHGTGGDNLDRALPRKCAEIDRPVAALIKDLKQRGLLDDTLVVWGGEFGRTPMRELRAGVKTDSFGRDHHKEAFTIWLAGAGVKGGAVYGETDPFGFSIAKNPVHIRDLQATLLHLLGLDSQRHVFPFQGLNQRLTGVAEVPRVVHEIFS